MSVSHNLSTTWSTSKIKWVSQSRVKKSEKSDCFGGKNTTNPDTQVPLAINSTVKPLTSSRNFSASDALPAATHWKVAFCPALTSSSPSLEKCGALSKETDRERNAVRSKDSITFEPITMSVSYSRYIFIKDLGFFQIHKQEFHISAWENNFIQCLFIINLISRTFTKNIKLIFSAESLKQY